MAPGELSFGRGTAMVSAGARLGGGFKSVAPAAQGTPWKLTRPSAPLHLKSCAWAVPWRLAANKSRATVRAFMSPDYRGVSLVTR